MPPPRHSSRSASRRGWWQLTQDERRDIFEERSHHVRIGAAALPAVARRLHHSRDLGEPFDILTWFEFAPSAVGAFDEVLAGPRASEEWTYVEREVEVRLTRLIAAETAMHGPSHGAS